MAKLIWSKDAFNDLANITDFILNDSPGYAQIVGEAIIEASERALEEPYQGRMVPELGQGQIREKLIYSYRLIYQVVGEDIHIIAVVSTSRLLSPIVSNRVW